MEIFDVQPEDIYTDLPDNLITRQPNDNLLNLFVRNLEAGNALSKTAFINAITLRPNVYATKDLRETYEMTIRAGVRRGAKENNERKLDKIYNELVQKAKEIVERDQPVDPSKSSKPNPEFRRVSLSPNAKAKFDAQVNIVLERAEKAKRGELSKNAVFVAEGLKTNVGGATRKSNKYNYGNIYENAREILKQRNQNKFRDIEERFAEAGQLALTGEDVEEIEEQLALNEMSAEEFENALTEEEKKDLGVDEENKKKLLEEAGIISESFNDVSLVDLSFALANFLVSEGKTDPDRVANIFRNVIKGRERLTGVSNVLAAAAGGVGAASNILAGAVQDNPIGAARNAVGLSKNIWTIFKEVLNKYDYVASPLVAISSIMFGGFVFSRIFYNRFVKWLYSKTKMRAEDVVLKLLMEQGLPEEEAKKTGLYNLVEQIGKNVDYNIDQDITPEEEFDFETLIKLAEKVPDIDVNKLLTGDLDYAKQLLENKDVADAVANVLPKENSGIFTNYLKPLYRGINKITETFAEIPTEAGNNAFKNAGVLLGLIGGGYYPKYELGLPSSDFNGALPDIPDNYKVPRLVVPPPMINETPMTIPPTFTPNILALPSRVYKPMSPGLVPTPMPTNVVVNVSDGSPAAENVIPENIINFQNNINPNIMQFTTPYKTYEELPEYMKALMTKEQYEARMYNQGGLNNVIDSKFRELNDMGNSTLVRPYEKKFKYKPSAMPILMEPVGEVKLLSPVPVVRPNSIVEKITDGYQNLIGTDTNLLRVKRGKTLHYFEVKQKANEQLIGTETSLIIPG